MSEKTAEELKNDLNELVDRADKFYDDVLNQIGNITIQDHYNLNQLGMLLDRLKKERNGE